ncbi:tRNA adenosine(34) deaminase TadA [uncultured Psychrobacter sp.]|uniref:tRNA adenosine(34) deaminase TadA n=1 Tax=uncultured Psychrobacter sp. TaxID=259303 RepID=UPI0034578DA9
MNKQLIDLQPHHWSSDQIMTSQFWSIEDVRWMYYALALAQQGANRQEVPVGAVLVHNRQLIGQGFNQPISSCDATAHAEIIALRDACKNLKNYRLPAQTTLYVTLEPCTMCVGALIHARVDRLVYAASEPRAGMVGSQMNLLLQSFYNHNIQVDKGLCSEPSGQMLKTFFRQRRQMMKKRKGDINKEQDTTVDASDDKVFLL